MARPKKSKGLGDTIEKITEATGIKAVVEAISEATGIDCGCGDENSGRHKWLNDLFPYKKVECLNDSDKEYLTNFFSTTNNQLTPKQQTRIIEIYKNVFNQNISPSNCGSCWRDRINELKKVYETQNT